MRMDTTGAVTLIDFEPAAADFRAEFTAGLRTRPRRLPCKFFYDERGSKLFDRICALPEYYPTRTEHGILAGNIGSIAALCGPECLLVELGSGSSAKTRLLLNELDRPAGYVPIDISRTHLQHAAAALAAEYPALEILPVCADYAQSISLPVPTRAARRTVIFFPGSTVGNFEPPDAVTFLQRVATWCQPGDRLLIGVDLEKSRDVLVPAYNDAGGITAAFNLNILVRANAELRADFRLDRFLHEAIYNTRHGRIEMHLVSTCAQTVTIERERFTFDRGERIVTEFSYKYRPARWVRLVQNAGWSVIARWSDPRQWFAVFALELR
jgi:dimethylhistidine N-methyltransferase